MDKDTGHRSWFATSATFRKCWPRDFHAPQNRRLRYDGIPLSHFARVVRGIATVGKRIFFSLVSK